MAAFLAWVAAHPVIAISVVFAVALAESLFLIGLLVPGAIFMFAFGALAGAHSLSAPAVFAAGIAGTLLGDAASYALGRRYQGRLGALPGLWRVPGGVARGEAFFARHGGKGIILGRLIGALRPVMPTIAGAAGLSPRRFVVMDVIATLLWAMLYIAPGLFFGASMDIAAQLATRLLIVALVAAFLVWAITSAARFLIVSGRAIGRRHADHLMAWSSAHRRLGLLGPALADPRQPELPALGVAAGLVGLASGLGYGLIWYGRPGAADGQYPARLDALIYWLLHELQNTPVDMIARVLAQLGTPIIYLPFALAVAGLLLWRGNWRAGAHWIAAIILSALVTLVLVHTFDVPRPVVLHGALTDNGLWRTGGGPELFLVAVIYGLAGAMVAIRASEGLRAWLHSATIALVVLIALSRLYLGLAWASDLLITLVAAFVWLNLLLLGYRRQRPRPIASMPLTALFLACLGVATVLAPSPASPLSTLGRTLSDTPAPAVLADWAGHGYARLPARIDTLQGRPGPLINVQVQASRAGLVAGMIRAGWQVAPPLSITRALHMLVPETPVAALAVWPTLHAGHVPAMVFVHDSQTPGQRWVLRFWASGHIGADRRQPIWLGTIDRQSRHEDLRLMVTARDQAGYDRAGLYLARQLAAQGIAIHWPDASGRGPLLFSLDAPDTPGTKAYAPMLK